MAGQPAAPSKGDPVAIAAPRRSSPSTVAILGPDAALDIAALAASIARGGGDLLLLSLGGTPTPAQRDALRRAQECAAQLGFVLEERLVAGTDEVIPPPEAVEGTHAASALDRAAALLTRRSLGLL